MGWMRFNVNVRHDGSQNYVTIPPSDLASQAGEKIDVVLATLAFTDDTILVLSRLPDTKFRATSKSWDEAKVFLPDQVLEVRMVGGRIRIARKDKRRDLGDLQQEPEAVLPDGEITEFLGA